MLVLLDLECSLLKKSLSKTRVLWKGDEWLLALSNDEDVAETSGEGVSL